MTAPQLLSFDVETNIVDGDAGAWRDGTYVVLAGFAVSPEDVFTAHGLDAWRVLRARRPVCVAGHAMSFDLCHVLKARGDDGLRWLLDPAVHFWDTQIADYLIQGCGVSMPSLEESGARFGVSIVKDTWASASFERGIGADVLMIEDGPRLTNYLRSDLSGTYALALAQRDIVKRDPRLVPVVATQMRALKLVAICQHFGMPIDSECLATLTQENAAAILANEGALKAALGALIENPIAREQFSTTSPKQLAALIFGGTITYETREQIGLYKTGVKQGMPRYRVIDHDVCFPLRVKGEPRIAEDGQERAPSTGETALKYMAAQTDTPPEVKALIAPLLKERELTKLDGTYYRPIARKAAISFDGNLHGSINQAVTNTGRKSSSGPNLQNIPDLVRRAIAAPAGHVIVAADFKQLEVVALGYLSGDPALRAVLQSPNRLVPGKDVHGVVNAAANAKTGRDIKRTDVKRVVFGRIYGGGAATLSAQSGIPEEVVSPIIEQLDSAFPVAARFYRGVSRALGKARQRDAQGEYSDLRLPSGRLLRFRACPKTGEFAYTEMKNRPVQSFATADIVPFAEQAAVAWLAQDPARLTERRVVPIVVVHDEIVFLVRADAVDELRAFLRELQARMVENLNLWYSMPIPLDLPLDISVGVGPSWFAAKEAATVLT